MPITNITTTFNTQTNNVRVQFTYEPSPSPPAAVNGGFMFFGPSNTYTGTPPQYGLPNSARVFPDGGNVFHADVSPGVSFYSSWYFVCGVELEDASQIPSSLQTSIYGPPVEIVEFAISNVTYNSALATWRVSGTSPLAESIDLVLDNIDQVVASGNSTSYDKSLSILNLVPETSYGVRAVSISGTSSGISSYAFFQTLSAPPVITTPPIIPVGGIAPEGYGADGATSYGTGAYLIDPRYIGADSFMDNILR